MVLAIAISTSLCDRAPVLMAVVSSSSLGSKNENGCYTRHRGVAKLVAAAVLDAAALACGFESLHPDQNFCV